MSRRLERSGAGQAFLACAMVVLVAAVVVFNMPAGRARQALLPAAGTIVEATGFEQDWGLFAPEPRDNSVGVVATITHADGRTLRWTPPAKGLLVAPYRTYRWQKFVERLRADDYEELWSPFARWVARRSGDDVTRVELTRTFRPVLVPGDRGPRPARRRFGFHTEALP